MKKQGRVYESKNGNLMVYCTSPTEGDMATFGGIVMYSNDHATYRPGSFSKHWDDQEFFDHDVDNATLEFHCRVLNTLNR